MTDICVYIAHVSTEFLSSSLSPTMGKSKELSKDVRNKTVYLLSLEWATRQSERSLVLLVRLFGNERRINHSVRSTIENLASGGENYQWKDDGSA